MKTFFDKILASGAGAGLLLTVAAASLPGPAAAQALQDHRSIQSAARAFVASRHPWQGLETRLETGTLDSRTRLRRCGTALQAFLPPGAQVKQRTTVGVRCNDASGWKIYLPVTVRAYAQALVATRPLPPGTILGEADVQLSRRDIAALGYGYLPSLDAVGGYRTRLSIAQGAVLTPVMVESAVKIRRGQTVTLVSRSGTVNVSMAGEALSDASLGKRIKVRNSNSGRVIEGIVRGEELVEVQ